MAIIDGTHTRREDDFVSAFLEYTIHWRFLQLVVRLTVRLLALVLLLRPTSILFYSSKANVWCLYMSVLSLVLHFQGRLSPPSSSIRTFLARRN
jgi:hypothetical protein